MANVLIDENILIGWADQIREKTGTSEKMRPSVLLEKTESLGSGGGSSDLVKYVTFMSEDGTQELYKMPVLSGDDCKDPVAHGDIDAPTKESTTTETFTHSGWSLEIGGEVNNSALSDVTANRIVYAAFVAGVRYYTVNLWMEEGVLFETLQVAYGGKAEPSSEPTKDDHIFTGWSPGLYNVTADRDCYAQFAETTDFAHASWANISKISKAGKARELYSLGDEKEIDLGELGTVTVQIAGFDHDISNSITLICKTIPANYKKKWVADGTTISTSKSYLYTSYIDDQIEAIRTTYMQAELRNVIRQVPKRVDASKVYLNETDYATYYYYLWAPSLTELGFSKAPTSPFSRIALGTKYELFNQVGGPNSDVSIPIIYDNDGNVAKYWTRHITRGTQTNTNGGVAINDEGKTYGTFGQWMLNDSYGVRFGFCV